MTTPRRSDLDVSPVVLDIEVLPLLECADYLDPPQAPRNLKDPEKIAAALAEKQADQLSRAGLDPLLGRICAVGTWSRDAGEQVQLCLTEADERDAIGQFWDRVIDPMRLIVGYSIRFDLRYLLTRSRLLGLPTPPLDLGRYPRLKRFECLYEVLTFGEMQHFDGVMSRSLRSVCRRLGLPYDTEVEGKQVPELWAAGDYAAVAEHCRRDVESARELARWLGLLN